MSHLLRRPFYAALLGVLGLHASAAAPLPAPTKAFLQKHCFECHDADTQKGKVRLDTLPTDFASPAIAETWGKVFAQLEKREMPPKKKAQPSDAERQAVLDWLGRELRVAAVSLAGRPTVSSGSRMTSLASSSG